VIVSNPHLLAHDNANVGRKRPTRTTNDGVIVSHRTSTPTTTQTLDATVNAHDERPRERGGVIVRRLRQAFAMA